MRRMRERLTHQSVLQMRGSRKETGGILTKKQKTEKGRGKGGLGRGESGREEGDGKELRRRRRTHGRRGKEGAKHDG